MKSKTGTIIPLGIILILISIVVILITSFFEFQGLRNSEKLVMHAQDVLLESEKLLTNAVNNETGSRGYILTGNTNFLDPLEKSVTEVKKQLIALREKTKGHLSQQRRVDSLELYVAKRIAFSEKTVALAKERGFEAAKKLVESEEGKLYTDKIRIYIDSIQNDENVRLKERKIEGEKNTAKLNTILLVVLLGLLLLLGWFFQKMRADITASKKEAAQALFESDEKYRNIVEAVPEGIWLIDSNDKTVFVNTQFTEMLGYTLEKASEITPFDFIINSDRRNQAAENVKKGNKEQFENAFITNHDKTVWISLELNPLIREGNYRGCLVITSDITKRKKAELLVAAESRVMEKIALNHPLKNILETIVLNIETSVDGGICSVLLLDKGGKHLHNGAAPHLPDEYNAAVEGIAIGEGQGCCGTAAFRKETVMVEDIASSPLWKGFEDIAARYGLKACWSTPILSDTNTVLGTFAVYYKTARQPLLTDYEIVQRATSQVKIAVEKDFAAAALRESEQKYRTLVEQASDAIFIAELNGRFITVNNAAGRLTQYPVEELMQKSFFDFTIGEDIAKNPLKFNELKMGKTAVAERQMMRKDGSQVEIEITGKLLDDGRLLAFVRDISERKKAEKIIKYSEARYRAFFENSMDGILLGAPDGSIYAANPAACYIYGRTEEELCIVGRAGLSDPNDSSMQDFLHERSMLGRSRKEVMQKRKDGSLFPAEVSSSIFTDSLGEERTIILVRDISDRVRANNEVIKEKNLSDSIINSLPGVFYLYSYDWKFIRWNKNFEQRTGYTTEEIEKMHPLDFFGPEDHLDVTEKIKNVFISGEEKTEITVSTKSGDKFPYFLTGKLIDYEGKPSLLGIGFDISDRLKAQEEVRQSNEQLRLLTSHLQQVREDERKRIAREIHDELGQQITAIKMDVAWVDKNTPEQNSTQKEKLKNIIGLLDSSNLSIRHILKELRMGVLDDYGLVEALQWLGRQFTSSTGIPVTFSSTEAVLKVDENISVCVFRVYQEALTNITKHANAANVAGSLTTEEGYVCLQIKDDGKGFDPETLKNNLAFGILGLKERVSALKGVFELSSSPGNGTLITVKIPV